MNVLAIVGISLGLGWGVIWFLMNLQIQRQSELEKKLDELEKRSQ